jgi:DNA-binding transcriptional regulator YdaS (Cro superfamily)
MKTEDAVKRYGSKAALARVLDITPQAISQWGEDMPELQTLKLEKFEAQEGGVK